ncbi:MAG TPA: flagellar hook-basal body complex protein FliE [Clostridia bacterium]|nr:flagellar hook-basal body complex protein FliE [Clostridia bacterium]
MRVENIILKAPEMVNDVKGKTMDNTSEFKDILKNIISETQGLQEQNANNNKLMSAGEIDSLDNVMIQMEKADIALQFTMQIRNKVLEAYQEIMRIQI